MIKFKQAATVALFATGLVLGNTAQAELRYRIKDLGTLGGIWSYGTGINASGQVVGDSEIVGPNRHIFVTNSKNKMIDLGTLAGEFFSQGTGINASGQITGISYNYIHNSLTAVTANNSGMVGLGTLGGVNSWGMGINDSGQVTGWSNLADGTPTLSSPTAAGKWKI